VKLNHDQTKTPLYQESVAALVILGLGIVRAPCKQIVQG